MKLYEPYDHLVYRIKKRDISEYWIFNKFMTYKCHGAADDIEDIIIKANRRRRPTLDFELTNYLAKSFYRDNGVCDAFCLFSNNFLNKLPIKYIRAKAYYIWNLYQSDTIKLKKRWFRSKKKIRTDLKYRNVSTLSRPKRNYTYFKQGAYNLK